MGHPTLFLILVTGPRGAALRDSFVRNHPWIGKKLGSRCHLVAIGDPRVRDTNFEAHVESTGRTIQELSAEWGERCDRHGPVASTEAAGEFDIAEECGLDEQELPALVACAEGQWESRRYRSLVSGMAEEGNLNGFWSALCEEFDQHRVSACFESKPVASIAEALDEMLERFLARLTPTQDPDDERCDALASWNVAGRCKARRAAILRLLVLASEPIKGEVIARKLNKHFDSKTTAGARTSKAGHDCRRMKRVVASRRGQTGYSVRPEERSKVRWALEIEEK